MRATLGILALLVTALVVGLLVRRQLKPVSPAPAAGISAPAVADPLQAAQQVRDGLAAAEAEARRRNDAAEQRAN